MCPSDIPEPLVKQITDPDTSKDWLEVANSRMGDALYLAAGDANHVGCVYIAGYAIECGLKAYLQHIGKARPTMGADGHNLRALWASCNFVLADLNDKNGSKSYFMSGWTTALRYQSKLNCEIEPTELVQGAQKILARLCTQIRRKKSRKGTR